MGRQPDMPAVGKCTTTWHKPDDFTLAVLVSCSVLAPIRKPSLFQSAVFDAIVCILVVARVEAL